MEIQEEQPAKAESIGHHTLLLNQTEVIGNMISAHVTGYNSVIEINNGTPAKIANNFA